MSGRWRRVGGRAARRTCVRFPSDPSRTMGCMDRASLEQLLGRGLSLAEIGRRFGKHEATVAYWVEKHGLQAVNHSKHAARGALVREELERLVASGASIAEIAEALERSKPTVRHWLREYGLTTWRGTMRQVRADQRASSAQPTRTILDCPHHGATAFQLRAEGGYRCLKCRSDAVTRRRRRVKQLLVEEAGGCVSRMRLQRLPSSSTIPSYRTDGQEFCPESPRRHSVAGKRSGGGKEVRPALCQLPHRG